MTFYRTTDMRLVRELLTDARLWSRITDDAAPARETFAPKVCDRLLYVVAEDRGKTVALFVLVTNFHQAEVHFTIVPEACRRSVKIGRAFLEWVWRETSLTWLVGPVPAYNRRALRLAILCGFTKFCEERGCVTKDGKKYDRLILQVSRPPAI